MTDFVENIKVEVTKAKKARQKCLSSSYLTDIFNYANFLKQPLTLGMFVPVDAEGNFLEEPHNDGLNDSFFKMQIAFHEEKKYIESKEKVLFEGFQLNYFTEQRSFEVIDGFGCKVCVYKSQPDYFIWNHILIESLTKIDVTLTETAIKMIYGN